jgi:hypothetical protein
MDQRKEQRVCIKFCANLEKSATKTLTIIRQAFWYQSLSRAQVFQWHARFKTGRTSVDDDEHIGRHTSCRTPETVARTKKPLRQDRRRTIHDISEEVAIGYGTWQRILTEEFGMHRVAAKFVPRILRAGQKQQRVNVCTEINWTEKHNFCYPPPTVLTSFGTLWLLPISRTKIEAERTLVWYHCGDPGRIAESAWHSYRKGLPESVPKIGETVGLVSTCGRDLLQGWRRSIGFMVGFMIFTASVRKILDTTLYVLWNWYIVTISYMTSQLTIHKPHN